MDGQVLFADGTKILLSTNNYDTRYKPGFFLQMREFLDAVTERRMPSFPSASIVDYLSSIRLAEQLLLNRQ